jgi:small subunit ribosomal protein S11
MASMFKNRKDFKESYQYFRNNKKFANKKLYNFLKKDESFIGKESYESLKNENKFGNKNLSYKFDAKHKKLDQKGFNSGFDNSRLTDKYKKRVKSAWPRKSNDKLESNKKNFRLKRGSQLPFKIRKLYPSLSYLSVPGIYRNRKSIEENANETLNSLYMSESLIPTRKKNISLKKSLNPKSITNVVKMLVGSKSRDLKLKSGQMIMNSLHHDNLSDLKSTEAKAVLSRVKKLKLKRLGLTKRKDISLKEGIIKREKWMKFKGWLSLYSKLKKGIQSSKGWAREWEERPKSWSRRIRNWEKNIGNLERSEKRRTFLKSQKSNKKNKKSFIPFYLRRKFYQTPKDPISWGYHEKCFSGGLKTYRKYNKGAMYRAKSWKNLREGGSNKDLQSFGKEVSRKILRKNKTLSAEELFLYIRRRSRVSIKMRRKGKNYNYHKLKKIRKEKAYLRRGIPKARIGIVHINAGIKNTIISLSDLQKNVKTWVSNGSVGFKRKKRKSPYASYVAGQTIGQKALELGYRGVIIYLKGVGKGRHNSCRGLATTRLRILRLKDRIRLPHNGCRLRKKRRV